MNHESGDKSPIRVLLTTPDYDSTGGIQTLTRNLEHGLECLGHTVQVVHVDSETPYSITDYIPQSRWSASLREFVTGRWVYRSVVHSTVADAIKQFNPDVVHALHVEHYPALAAAQEANLQSVLSCHALELQNEEIATKALTMADRIHTVSEFTSGLVRDIAVSNPSIGENICEHVHIIPPSIDIGSYISGRKENQDHILSENAPVLTLSRLEEGYKNIETVIDAWNQLSNDTTSQRDLVIAGDGPQRSLLETRAKTSSNVRFPGYVDEKEKRRLLTDAAVFAFVPREEGYRAEGFGIVYIEAQASGTPVVGSNNGGAPEAIGKGGLIIENESDPDELSDAIQKLLTDADSRQKCLSEVDKRLNQFGIKTVAAKHADQYRSLLTVS